MEVYYLLLAGLTVLWAGLCLSGQGRTKTKDRIFLAVAFGVMAFLAAARYDVGYDYTYVYAPEYERILTIPGYDAFNTRFEAGFVVLEKLLGKVSYNYHMLFVVTGILITGLFFIYYWQCAGNPYVAVFFFIALGQYYCTLDFIRQAIAAGILFAAFPLVQKRKLPHYLLYLALVALAFTFHESALIMIPFLFINHLFSMRKWWVTGLFGAVTIVCYAFVPRIFHFVTQYWYSVRHTTDLPTSAQVFQPHFAVFAGCYFLLMLLGSKLLIENNPANYLYINYAFFNFFFVLMGTRNEILDRFSMYFMFAVPVGFSILWDQIGVRYGKSSFLRGGFLKTDRKKIPFLLGAVFVCAGALGIHHYSLTADHHGVTPYKLIWNQPFYSHYTEWIRGIDDEPRDEILFDE